MGKLVLIVDDNEKNAKLARDLLELAGMRTLSATTAAAALALACEQQPDIILMDLRLPDLDGAEAARLLGADERTAHIPVIALSALPAEYQLTTAQTISAIGRNTMNSYSNFRRIFLSSVKLRPSATYHCR